VASAHEVICEQCCLPSQEKLGAVDFVLITGFTTEVDAVSISVSMYVGGMSSKSVDVDVATETGEVSVATSIVELFVGLLG